MVPGVGFMSYHTILLPCLPPLQERPPPETNLSRTYSSTTPSRISFFALKTQSLIIFACPRFTLRIALPFSASLYERLLVPHVPRVLKHRFPWYNYLKGVKSSTTFSHSYFP